MAFHLVAGSSYGLFQINAEELVENNQLLELLEKEVELKVDYFFAPFSFKALETKGKKLIHRSVCKEDIFGFVREVPPPPPDSETFFS